jgi:hypothetical protein
MKITAVRHPRSILLSIVWAAFLTALSAYYLHLNSDDPLEMGPRVSELRQLEFRSAHRKFVAALFVSGLVAFGVTVVLIAERASGRGPRSTRLAIRRVGATVAILLLPLIQYLAISNAGELYSGPGDDTGVWQYHSWFRWSKLPMRSFLYPFFPIVREPFWSISKPIIYAWAVRDRAQEVPWMITNFMTGPPRPWDVKFTAVNSALWLVITGVVYVIARKVALRRGRPPMDVAGVILALVMFVFALGTLNWARLEGPGPVGTVMGHLTAWRGRTVFYSADFAYPGREACDALVRERYGVERRYYSRDAPSPRQRYYHAFNHVMWSKVTDGRTLSSSMAKACEELRRTH